MAAKYWVIIDSDGKSINKVWNADGVNPDGYDSSTWIVVTGAFSAEGKTYSDGAWTTDTVSVDELRVERDKLLRSSDFTQLSDSPFKALEKVKWATYRQKLRDLPEDYTPVANPVYPTTP